MAENCSFGVKQQSLIRSTNDTIMNLSNLQILSERVCMVNVVIVYVTRVLSGLVTVWSVI